MIITKRKQYNTIKPWLAQAILRRLDATHIFTDAGLTPDPWQEEILAGMPRRALMVCARQVGKSTVAAAMVCHQAIWRNDSLVLVLSPTLRQSQEFYRKVRAFYDAVAQKPCKITKRTELTMELNNGSRIISLPGAEGSVRGYSGVSVLLIDEASRVDDDLYYAVRPMLAVSGGKIIALSTPFGRRGWFWDEWQAGTTAGWTTIRVTAYECPRIPPEFLEAEKRTMGQKWYAQEYECEFADPVDAVFKSDLVRNAITPHVRAMDL